MMSDNDEKLAAIVQSAQDQDPSGMGDVVTDILNNKTREFINTTRKEVASDYFGAKDTGANDETD